MLDQTYDSFEILCYHDGPLLHQDLDFPVPVKCTERRFNDFGHSLRDIGIREATGEYIVHFNPDNVLHRHALEVISSVTQDIAIFPIRMRGLERGVDEDNQSYFFYSCPRNCNYYVDFPGDSIEYGKIDCLQLVMKTELWRKEGGWIDKREDSDGFLYPKLARKYSVEYVSGEVLGEHY